MLKRFVHCLVATLAISASLLGAPAASASSYATIVKTNNTAYNARLYNQSSRNDGIYYYGPYNTKRSTTTRDASGKNWNHRFVRITQTVTLSNGQQYSKFAWYGKTIGWVNTAGLQKFSRSQNAQALLSKVHFQGSAMLISNYASGGAIVNMGYADAANKINNGGAVVYPIASLQKVITGALIEQLVAKGKLSMSTKLSQYFSSVPNAQNITIRSLLDHRSGIQMDETTPSSLLKTQSAQLNYTLSQLKSTGGASFNYTNANYTLLAGIASTITGQSYENLVNANIIQPLHLTNTFFWDTLPSNRLVAKGYAYSGGQDYVPDGVSQNLMSSLIGAGNMYSTPSDYYTIQKGLRNGKLLTASQYKQLANNNKYTYDGGMYHYSGGIKRVYGSLSGASYATLLYGTEGNKYGVIIFANQQGSGITDSLGNSLYDLSVYYPEH